MVLKPLVKFVGGKRKIAAEILTHLPTKPSLYVEPFVGGGGMFCAAYEAGLTENGALLADINTNVIQLYHDVQTGKGAAIHQALEDLNELYMEGDPSELYYRVREEWNSGEQDSVRFIFLKQLAFNGLWRENRKGGFNVPFGKYKRFAYPELEDFQAWEKALSGVQLWNTSFESVSVPYDALVYCDPPYAGTFTSYTKEGFNIETQKRLVMKCAEWGEAGFCALSNSDDADLASQVAELWPKSKSESIEITHTVSAKSTSRTKKQERLYLST